MRLTDLFYDTAGILHYPTERETLDEAALVDHLREARTLLEARPGKRSPPTARLVSPPRTSKRCAGSPPCPPRSA